jgi:hypothetical protein
MINDESKVGILFSTNLSFITYHSSFLFSSVRMALSRGMAKRKRALKKAKKFTPWLVSNVSSSKKDMQRTRKKAKYK